MVSFQPDLMMACLSTGARYFSYLLSFFLCLFNKIFSHFLLHLSIRSGIVLDISSTEIRCLAIAYGTPILSSYTTTSIGVLFTQLLFQQLFQYHCQSNNISNVDLETINDLYYRVACISPACVKLDGECWNHAEDVIDGHHLPVDVYDFPPTNQSRKVIIPGWMRSCCLLPLILGCDHLYFQPAIVSTLLESNTINIENNDEIGGAVGVVLSCLLKCSTDIRRYLLQHVIICGGGAAIPGNKTLFILLVLVLFIYFILSY